MSETKFNSFLAQIKFDINSQFKTLEHDMK